MQKPVEKTVATLHFTKEDTHNARNWLKIANLLNRGGFGIETQEALKGFLNLSGALYYMLQVTTSPYKGKDNLNKLLQHRFNRHDGPGDCGHIYLANFFLTWSGGEPGGGVD